MTGLAADYAEFIIGRALRDPLANPPYDRALIAELLADDPFLQAMSGVEQHAHGDGAVGDHLDAADIAGLVVIGNGRYRPLVAFEHFDHHEGLVRQQRAAPAPRAEGADRGEGEEGGVDGQDRTLRRQIIGGGAGGRGDEDAVGDQFGHALLLIDQDAQPRRLMSLAEQRDLVDGVVDMHIAMHVGGAHE